MSRCRIAVAACSVLAGFALPLAAEAHEMQHPPEGTVQLSPVVPGMGDHWADPKKMPLGPIYGTHDGKLVFIEFMISQQDFAKGADFRDLGRGEISHMPPIDHVDIEFQPNGHEGFEIPHYDIHMYFVSHKEHLTFK